MGTVVQGFGIELGKVVHACNPALGRLRQEDRELDASLGYSVRSCLRTKQNKIKTNKNPKPTTAFLKNKN